jgi:hypothetical protein
MGWIPARAVSGQIVPVGLEPHHHIRFENEYLRVLDIIVEPGDATLFHEHRLDMTALVLDGADLKNEVPDSTAAAIVRAEPESVSFFNYQKDAYVHRVTNLSDERFEVFSFEILVPAPGRFAAPDRTLAPAYESLLTNERVRAWRLRLGPGKSAEAILQAGPGLRVILGGDELTEVARSGAQSVVELARGNFEWQAPGRTRALRNTGALPLELVEFEIR